MLGELLTVDQALALIQQHAQPLSPARLPLSECLHRTLAAEATSDIDSPPHHKAMMDGYAVVSGDPAGERRIIEEVLAGAVPSQRVMPGAATRIMTGAPMPDGANAVVPVEQSELVDEQTVRLPQPGPLPGKHVMPRGEAFHAGDTVVSKETRLTASHLGLLAEAGVSQAMVFPQPRVGVLATGNELVDMAERPSAGQIRNSNGPMLRALVDEAGALPVDLGVARDLEVELEERIQAGLACDLLVVSGGVSAGKRDLAPAVLSSLGVTQVFHKVAVKPGKPLWFGVWEQNGRTTCVFGLPGNPVSGYVCFQLFVRPLLSVLAGGPYRGASTVEVTLDQELSLKGGRETYLPVVLSQQPGSAWRAAPADWRGSADLRGLAVADALLRIPAESVQIAAGSRQTALLLHASAGFAWTRIGPEITVGPPPEAGIAKQNS